MKFSKPWYRPNRGVWYVTIEGTQHNLGPDKEDAILGKIRDRAFRDLLIAAWETGCRPQESLIVEASFRASSRHPNARSSRRPWSRGCGPTAIFRSQLPPPGGRYS